MKKYHIFIIVALFLTVASYAQDDDQITAIQADQVQVSRSTKRAARRDAKIRQKTRELTRDLIEKGRLQFEPEIGFYHGTQMNFNFEHFTKTGGNTLNSMGSAEGWHEDTSGGDYSGRPVIQVYNGRFYSNLEPIILREHNYKGIRAKDYAITGPSGTGIEIEFNSSEETLSNWHSFNTEFYKIQNYEEKSDYLLGFDIVVNAFNMIDNVSYNKFTFQCVLNILDGRMTVRIIAGENRVCATYFGYMNILRGNSF